MNNILIDYFNKNMYFYIEKYRIIKNMKEGKEEKLIKFISYNICIFPSIKNKYTKKELEELKKYLHNIFNEIVEKYKNVYYLIKDKRDNTIYECKIYNCVDDDEKNLYYLAKRKDEKFISGFYYSRMDLLYNLYCNNEKHNFKNIDTYNIYELIKIGIK